jgi:hypothetical protein
MRQLTIPRDQRIDKNAFDILYHNPVRNVLTSLMHQFIVQIRSVENALAAQLIDILVLSDNLTHVHVNRVQVFLIVRVG